LLLFPRKSNLKGNQKIISAHIAFDLINSTDLVPKTPQSSFQLIHLLPTELQLEIFSYLDVASLKTVALLDKHCFMIVSQSVMLRLKISNVMPTGKALTGKAIQNLNRRYNEIKFSEILTWPKYLINFISRGENSITILVLEKCSFKDNELSRIVSLSPRLSELQCLSCMIADEAHTIDGSTIRVLKDHDSNVRNISSNITAISYIFR
jgi:hypothetical protein